MRGRHGFAGALTAAALLLTAQTVLAGAWLPLKLGRARDCDHGCGSCATCRVCKPVADKKKVTKTVYECKEEWYCLPKCSCPMHKSKDSCCDDAGSTCTSCEQPRVRRILIKKLITTEVPTTKCVVETIGETDEYATAPSASTPAAARRGNQP